MTKKRSICTTARLLRTYMVTLKGREREDHHLMSRGTSDTYQCCALKSKFRSKPQVVLHHQVGHLKEAQDPYVPLETSASTAII